MPPPTQASQAPIYQQRGTEYNDSAARRVSTGSPGRWHAPFIAGEVLIVVLATVLAVLVAHHPAPLPGDAGLALAEQHLILPHAVLTQALDAVSTINWPLPSAISLVVVTIVLLLLRRRLAAGMALLVAGLADGSSYLTNEIVRRPRPSDHVLHVLQHIKNYYSFPSGHVIHALAFFGFLVFVTYLARHPAAWVWVVRVVLVLLIVLMAPSRVLEGEHWPSDVLEGLLYGAFWLVAGIHAYRWAWQRWPRLRGRHEQDSEEDGEPTRRGRTMAYAGPRGR